MFQHTNTDTKTEAAQSLACSIPQFCSIHKQGKHTPEPFCDQYAEFCYQHPPIPQFNTKTNKRSYTRARVRKDPIILNQIAQTDKQKPSLSFRHTALLNRKTLWSIRKKKLAQEFTNSFVVNIYLKTKVHAQLFRLRMNRNKRKS